MTTAHFTSKDAAPTARFRRLMASFFFAPVGRFNVLALLGSIVGGVTLIMLAGFGSWMNIVVRTMVLIAGAAPMIASWVYFMHIFSDPFTPEQRNRIMIAEAGSFNPSRTVKKHPERVAAYQRLVDEIGREKSDYKDSAAFHNASELVLSGKLTEDDAHFITAAIQQGAVTTEEILSSVNDLRSNSVVPLLGGIL